MKYCLFAIMLLVAGCSTLRDYPQRTVDELLDRGFYVYQLGINDDWSSEVTIWSFNKHCSGSLTEDKWNPIHITFTNEDIGSFDIRISPQDAIWNNSIEANSIELNADWIPSMSGQYYQLDTNLIVIKVKDAHNMDVIVSSMLGLDVLVLLIEDLHYIHSPEQTVTDPWAETCGYSE